MVAIGLYEEEHGIHFSSGSYRQISGTGSMEKGGRVGSVGALEHKLLGAEAAGMDLFFVPGDYNWLGEAGNEAESSRVKQKHGLSLQIVPVQTLDEAIKFLSKAYMGGTKR